MRFLADYKRVVSYIYLYNHQLKGNNVGFARMETRNHQCKIMIHVRVPNLVEQTVKAYIYCWYDQKIHGVLLGEVHIQKGTGDLSMVTDPENLCNSGYSLDEMSGIIVYLSDTQFLGTEWDDRPIVFDRIEIDNVRTKERVTPPPSTNQVPEKTEKSKEQEGKEQESQHPYISFPGVAVEAIQNKTEANPIWKGETTWQQICEDQQSRMEKSGQKEFELPSKEIEESLEYEESQSIKEGNTFQEEQTIAGQEEERDSWEKDLVQSMNMQGDYSEAGESASKEFPLSQDRISSLDRQAKELFNSMMFGTLFQESPSSESPQEKEEDFSVVISPKSAIECFTAFKTCESNEEYQEIQCEIGTLKSQIAHLERISEEWLIKLARIEEERAERAREKEILESKLRETFHIDTDVFTEEEEEMSDVSQQSIALDTKKTELPVSAVVTRIFAKYPKIEPFVENEDIVDCVRIEPQDIGIFPMENWILANNSFLLHGYYSYRHLVFAMWNNGGKAEFFLGVPGVRHSRELFMAKMFGFNTFRLINQEEQGEGSNEEFGYWCMPINMPEQ